MVTQLSPRVARLRAANPSPMTLEGTNGYVIHAGPRALIAIDPGPKLASQRDAFLAYARDANAAYVAIIVTHGHPDHFPGAAPLAAATGAPVLAHPAARFPRDQVLANGERLRYDEATLRVVHAPGHAIDHIVLSFEEEASLFTGDVVIGRGTVVIAPPGGDMRTYQKTLARLYAEFANDRAIYGGHGPAVRNVRAKLEEYIAHRAAREAQLLDALDEGAATLPELVARVYKDVDRVLWPAAGRQLLAYLIALEREGVVVAERLDREMTRAEAAILDPDLYKLGDGMSTAVIRAELGYGASEPLVRYALTAAP